MTHWYIGDDGYPHYNEAARIQEIMERAEKAETDLAKMRNLVLKVSQNWARDTPEWIELYHLTTGLDLSRLQPRERKEYFPGDREIEGLHETIRSIYRRLGCSTPSNK